MPDLSESLRTWLLPTVTPTVDDRVHVDHAPQLEQLLKADCTPEDIKPYVWVSRAGVDRDGCLGESGTLPDSEDFDIECTSRDIATSKALATLLHGLDSSRLQFDGIWCDVFVTDQSDDYQSRTQAVELGLFVTALAITVVRNQ